MAKLLPLKVFQDTFSSLFMQIIDLSEKKTLRKHKYLWPINWAEYSCSVDFSEIMMLILVLLICIF